MSSKRALAHIVFGAVIAVVSIAVAVVTPGYWGWGGIQTPMICLLVAVYGGAQLGHGLVNFVREK